MKSSDSAINRAQAALVALDSLCAPRTEEVEFSELHSELQEHRHHVRERVRK